MISTELALLAAALAFVGCAGERALGRQPTTPVVAGTPYDWGLDLARRLPRGADLCGVARPALVGSEERALYARVAHAPPIAWHADLRVRAYATAERGRRASSAPAEVVLLRVEASQERTRALLGPATGLDLRWDGNGGAECAPDACPTVARFVEPQLVRLDRGSWPTAPSAEGIAARCRALVERHPDAVEVWARRARALPAGPTADAPLRWTSIVRVGAKGVQIEGEELMPDAAVAERVRDVGGDPTRMAARLGVAAVAAERRRVDAAVIVEIDVLWEDLELVRDDEVRFERARRYATALGRLVPEAEIDAGSAEALAAQIVVRLDLIEHAVLPDREVFASARSLIESARKRHPDQVQFERLRERFEQLTVQPGVHP